jgi:TRAP-type transport system small permease protein
MLKLVDRTVGGVVAALVAFNAVIVCLNVFYRYVLSSGIVWANEIPGFLLVCIGFLGAYLATRSDGHIAFDMLVEMAPTRIQLWLRSLNDVIVIGFLGLLVALSVRMINVVGGTELETLDLAKGWFMAVVPISAGLMIVALATRLIARWRS